MKDWWFSRSARERVMLMVMTAIALPVLGWLLVARPLADATAEARAEYLLALDRNARVKALLASDENRTASIDLPLTEYLEAQAGQRGLTLSVNALDAPGQARIAIAQANGQALLGWLAELEAVGLLISNVQITPGDAGGMAMSATITEPLS